MKVTVYRRDRSPFWWFDYCEHGVRVRRSSGTEHKTYAQRLARKLEEQAWELDHFPEDARRRQGSLTVDQLLEARLRDRKSVVSPLTYESYDLSARRMKPIIGHLDARTITREDLRQYRNGQLEAGFAPASVNRDMMLLGSAFRQATADDLMDRNPVAGLQHLPEPEPSEVSTVVDWKDVERVMDKTPAWHQRFILTCYLTGNRTSELCNVLIEDLDLEAGELTFRARNVKGRRGRRQARTIQLVPDLIPVLTAQVQDSRELLSPWLYPSRRDPRQPMTSNAATNAWRRACALAKVKARQHDLRHTFTTRMIQSGLAAHLVARYIGHRSARMIEQRYDHTKPTGLGIITSALEHVRRTLAVTLPKTAVRKDEGNAK